MRAGAKDLVTPNGPSPPNQMRCPGARRHPAKALSRSTDMSGHSRANHTGFATTIGYFSDRLLSVSVGFSSSLRMILSSLGSLNLGRAWLGEKQVFVPTF